MASIKELSTKKGISYRITVSNGYDKNGHKIVKTTTFKPDSTLTPTQQKKALDKFAMDFENKVKIGEMFDGDKMSFELFAEKWLEDVKDNLAYKFKNNLSAEYQELFEEYMDYIMNANERACNLAYLVGVKNTIQFLHMK